MRIGDTDVDDWLMDQACKEYKIKKHSIIVDEKIIQELNDDFVKTFFDTKKIPLVAIDEKGNIYKFIKLNVLTGARVPLAMRIYYTEENT